MSELRAALAGLAVVVVAGCGAPGLPAAGPGAGEVEVGYGAKPSSEVTGAVTSLSGDQAAGRRPVRLPDLLRGKVAGLQVVTDANGITTYRIRGKNSLLSDQEPLFVVDGIQMNSAGATTVISGLQYDDIRQVDVLKDVASTSVYGMSGAGGVIIITTRR
ncbi:MAG TPA: TonB-dependent receptor plug domain-containing protein [Longimicrobiales bacterium]